MLIYINLNLNFIREVSLNHLFQIGGKSLKRWVKAIVSNVFYTLTGMNIRRIHQILLTVFLQVCSFT